MEKHGLANLLTEILSSHGFKKKGNYWVKNNGFLTIIVNLQKSQYGNFYYINYGYIIPTLPLNGLTIHIYHRLTSSDVNLKARLTELLDLDNDVPDLVRVGELQEFLTSHLVEKLVSINNEHDLYLELKSREHLYDIPLIVKKYFELPAD